MRDYRFGNFLRELRERRGLSQYQLGRLVGVSDKAVSKWENGSSKPQNRILCQLSGILGVTADELLTCKYRTLKRETEKESCAEKNKLWKKSRQALRGRYGSVLPVEILNRYLSESAELQDTELIVYFDLLGRIRDRVNALGGQIRVNGSFGASFVAFILGASEINPLKPHYFCPKCGSLRFDETVLCGWDLPARRCACGEEYLRDGHDLPFETLRPFLRKNTRFNLSVSPGACQAAKELIDACLEENTVFKLTADQNLDSLSLLEKESGISLRDVDFACPDVLKAFQEGRTDGVLDFGSAYSKTLLGEIAPSSFHDLIQTAGLAHGSGVWPDNASVLIQGGMNAGAVIAYREDVFRHIQKKMTEKKIFHTGFACQVMEHTRRGFYAKNGVPDELRQQLASLGLEDWFSCSLGKIQYLFPEAFGAAHVKYALILMWYKLKYPEVFRKLFQN